MIVRLVLAVLLSAFFCFPGYASSASPVSASPSGAFSRGHDIPDLPEDVRYKEYAIVKTTVKWLSEEGYDSLVLFAFYSAPVVSYGGYGFEDDILHFSGHMYRNFDIYFYSLSLNCWVFAEGQYGLFNYYDLQTDPIVMSTSTIIYQDSFKVFYYYFPVTTTFESQPMLSDFVQLVYRIVIALIGVIVLIIGIRIFLRTVYRVIMFRFGKVGS